MNLPDTYCLKDGDLAVLVSPRGGSLRGLDFAGNSVMMPAGGPLGDMANFPLVPFGNRIEFNRFQLNNRTYAFRPNSADPFYLHGDGWLCDWSLVAVEDSSIELALQHHPDDLSPYHYSAWQRISVNGNAVTFELSVTNDAEETMPFGLGQHPFFVRTPATRITASVREYWSERTGHLPGTTAPTPDDLDFQRCSCLPKRFINNAFGGWNGTALIAWPELGITAAIDASPAHDVLMIYAPAERDDFFCLEPMTHLPNAHQMKEFGGLTLLSHAETLHSQMTIQFRRQDNG